MTINRLEISKHYAETANIMDYSINMNEVRWKTLEFTNTDHRDSFSVKKVVHILINMVISPPYEKKLARNIETLCRNCQYHWLFYRYEWSSIKTLELTYTDHRDSFFVKIFVYFDQYSNILIIWEEIGSKYQNIMPKPPISWIIQSIWMKFDEKR